MKKYEGFTPNEFIEDHLNELNEDAIGLWQFVSDKLLFDFTDKELKPTRLLIDFLKQRNKNICITLKIF